MSSAKWRPFSHGLIVLSSFAHFWHTADGIDFTLWENRIIKDVLPIYPNGTGSLWCLQDNARFLVWISVTALTCRVPGWNTVSANRSPAIGDLNLTWLGLLPLATTAPGRISPLVHRVSWHIDCRKTSSVRRAVVGNKIVGQSDVVGASPVGAAPTTFTFST